MRSINYKNNSFIRKLLRGSKNMYDKIWDWFVLKYDQIWDWFSHHKYISLSIIIIMFVIIYYLILCLVPNVPNNCYILKEILKIITQTIILGVFLALFSNIIVEHFKLHGFFRKDIPDFNEFESKIDQDLYVLGLTLSDVHSEKESKDFMKSIGTSINNNKNSMTLRFLLCDPRSNLLKLRELEEMGKPNIDIFENKYEHRMMTEAIKTIARLQYIKNEIIQVENDKRTSDKTKITFEFKIYRSIPKHSIRIIDDKYFIGPYLLHKSGRNTMWIELEDFSLKYQLKNEFDYTWDNDILEVLLKTSDEDMKTITENIKNYRDPFIQLKSGTEVQLLIKFNVNGNIGTEKSIFIKRCLEEGQDSSPYYFINDGVVKLDMMAPTILCNC